MGLLAQKVKETPKLDFPFTCVEIVAQDSGKVTTIKVVDECYSLHGCVVKTIELPSFEGMFASLYNYTLKSYLDMAFKVEQAARAGKYC